MSTKRAKQRKIHITLAEEVHQRLRVKCAIEDTTIQEYVARLIEESVKGIQMQLPTRSEKGRTNK